MLYYCITHILLNIYWQAKIFWEYFCEREMDWGEIYKICIEKYIWIPPHPDIFLPQESKSSQVYYRMISPSER